MSFIELKNINKKYKGNEKNSVTDFNLNIEEKEFIAFVWREINDSAHDCRF